MQFPRGRRGARTHLRLGGEYCHAWRVGDDQLGLAWIYKVIQKEVYLSLPRDMGSKAGQAWPWSLSWAKPIGQLRSKAGVCLVWIGPA